MSKILRNDDPINSIELFDTGVTVSASSSYTIPPQDYSIFAASSDVIRAISDSSLILNDGGNDITNISNAIDIIKGWPIQVTTTVPTPFFFNYADVPIGVGPHTLFSYVVGVGETLELNRVYINCRAESRSEVYKNGIAIASLSTGAAIPMSSFDWRPSYSCVAGDIIEIVLKKRNGAPDNDVGVHLMGAITTTT